MTKKQVLAAAVAATLSTAMITSGVTSVFAAEDPPASTNAPAKDQAKNDKAQKDFVKVSEDATTTMFDLSNARLAIFNGQPGRARTYVDAAVTRVGAAFEEADKSALDTKSPKADDRFVPFDANLTVLKKFEPTPENAKHIAKANEHLHKGEKKKAIEELKLGAIDVAIRTSMIPIKFAKEHIDHASKLLDEHKYYEANLALKAVEDAVLVETYGLDEVPEPQAKTRN